MSAWPFISNAQGSAFIQKTAIVGFFVLAAAAGVAALSEATSDKFRCMAAAIAGDGPDGACGQGSAALPAAPIGEPNLITDLPVSHQVAGPRPPTAEEQAAIDEAVNSDPQLKEMYDSAIANGYTIQIGPPGSGAYQSPTTKTIVISEDYLDKGNLLSSLVHELAHANYAFPQDPCTLSFDQCLEARLTNEGHAWLHELALVDRLCDSGHPDCQALRDVVASTPESMAVWQRYEAGEIDAQQAAYELGQLYGTFITTTTQEAYTVYYGRMCQACGT
jgi:hypothetical protein